MPVGSTLRRRLVALLVAVLALPVALEARLLERPVDEVYAAFVFRFLYFVKDQPQEAPDGELCIGILGPDPFGALLDEADGRSVHGSRVRVRRFESVAEVDGCELVFVSPDLASDLDDAARQLRDRRVLTVSTADGFALRQGMIELSLQQDRVRFDINNRTAKQGGVHLSSELLEVARRVYR